MLPELLGFTNPNDVPFYENHPKKDDIDNAIKRYNLEPISEVWLVTTINESVKNAIVTGRRWAKTHIPEIKVRVFQAENLEDLRSFADCRQMKDLICRVVLKAHEEASGGKVFLSMVGGYKTMSSDMQNAAHILGCDALIHVLLEGRAPTFCENKKIGLVDEKSATGIVPVVVSGKLQRAAYLYDIQGISIEKFPVGKEVGDDCTCPSSVDLVNTLDQLARKAESILSNFSEDEDQKSFRVLTGLHPRKIKELKDTYINRKTDFDWVKRLPKAELHCHFGGILSPKEMVRVALSEESELENLAKGHPAFSDWLLEIKKSVEVNDIEKLRDFCRNKNKIRKPVELIPEPFGVCGFLMQFKNHEDLLEKVIYGDYVTCRNLNSPKFSGIGIEKYEQLGDLQGSGLMQSENCIREACRCLREQCIENNIYYLELRCSPVNYTRGGLSEKRVVTLLLEELGEKSALHPTHNETCFSLIFIASRHGRMSDVWRHVELVEELLSDQTTLDSFKKWFVGFDLAGSEKVRRAGDLRSAFEPLRKRCLNLTIHAGETDDAESIWEAVYELNADRIGHGLTLSERPDLQTRFVERDIAVEMCPSSNFQICKFRDLSFPSTESFKEYPLKKYLEDGLLVTLNTDDPGISRTNLTEEFFKAADMCDGKLSRWDVLRLIHNSFSSAFIDIKTRNEILRKAGKDILKLILEENTNGTR